MAVQDLSRHPLELKKAIHGIRSYVMDLNDESIKGNINKSIFYSKLKEYIGEIDIKKISNSVYYAMRSYDTILYQFNEDYFLEAFNDKEVGKEIQQSIRKGSFHISFPDSEKPDINEVSTLDSYLMDSETNGFVYMHPEKLFGTNHHEVRLFKIEHFSNHRIFSGSFGPSLRTSSRVKSNSESVSSKFLEYLIGKKDKYPSDIGAISIWSGRYLILDRMYKILKTLIPTKIVTNWRNLPNEFDLVSTISADSYAKNLATRIEEAKRCPTEEEREELIVGAWTNFKFKGIDLEMQLSTDTSHDISSFGPASHAFYKTMKNDNYLKYLEDNGLSDVSNVLSDFLREIFDSYTNENQIINLAK